MVYTSRVLFTVDTVPNRLPIRVMSLALRTAPRRNAKTLVASCPLTTSCSIPQISRLHSAVPYQVHALLSTLARLLENIP